MANFKLIIKLFIVDKYTTHIFYFVLFMVYIYKEIPYQILYTNYFIILNDNVKRMDYTYFASFIVFILYDFKRTFRVDGPYVCCFVKIVFVLVAINKQKLTKS